MKKTKLPAVVALCLCLPLSALAAGKSPYLSLYEMKSSINSEYGFIDRNIGKKDMKKISTLSTPIKSMIYRIPGDRVFFVAVSSYENSDETGAADYGERLVLIEKMQDGNFFIRDKTKGTMDTRVSDVTIFYNKDEIVIMENTGDESGDGFYSFYVLKKEKLVLLGYINVTSGSVTSYLRIKFINNMFTVEINKNIIYTADGLVYNYLTKIKNRPIKFVQKGSKFVLDSGSCIDVLSKDAWSDANPEQGVNP
jgi:hypothetical protein